MLRIAVLALALAGLVSCGTPEPATAGEDGAVVVRPLFDGTEARREQVDEYLSKVANATVDRNRLNCSRVERIASMAGDDGCARLIDRTVEFLARSYDDAPQADGSFVFPPDPDRALELVALVNLAAGTTRATACADLLEHVEDGGELACFNLTWSYMQGKPLQESMDYAISLGYTGSN